MPEHHFSVWGRELLPNPVMAAVDLAARSSRIRIGLAAAIVTFWHPLRAAEDIAPLDQLSGGRVEIGFGRGNYGLEAVNLNPEANPNDQVKNKLVFDEAVLVIKAALTQERFAFKGEIYQFPAPGFRPIARIPSPIPTISIPRAANSSSSRSIRGRGRPRCRYGRWSTRSIPSGTRPSRISASSCGDRRWRRWRNGCVSTATPSARRPASSSRSVRAPRSCATLLWKDSEEEAVRIAGAPMMEACRSAWNKDPV